MGPEGKSPSALWLTLNARENQAAVVFPLNHGLSSEQATLKIPMYAISLSPAHWSRKHYLYPSPDTA